MNVLAIGAHPDDVELYCAGTLARYAAEGHRVTIAVVCDGGDGVKGLPHAEAAQLREQESRKAASLIGADTFYLRYPDHRLPVDDTVLLQFTELLRRVRANAVITHDPNDCFIDHQRTAKLAEEAVYLATEIGVNTESPPSSEHPVLFYMDTVTGLSSQPSDYVDICDTFAIKRRMLECHQSQLQTAAPYPDEPTILDIMETAARFRGLQCGVRYAEAFCQKLKWDRAMTWRMLP